MRGRDRSRHERLRPTEARRVHTQRDALDEPLARRHTTTRLERQHSTEPREQLSRARMIGMTRQPRVVHALDRGMLREELRDALRRRVLMPHTNRERLEPAMQQE